MPWDAEREIDQDGIENVYAFNAENPDTRYLVYKINHNNSQIEFIPKQREGSGIVKIVLDGFKDLPNEFAEAGYIRGGGIDYYLMKKLGEIKVCELTISKTKPNRLIKVRNKSDHRMVLNYTSFNQLRRTLTNISTESKQERSAYADDFFHQIFPRKYPKKEISRQKRAKKLVRYLDENVIQHLSPVEVDKFLDFFEALLTFVR